MLTYYSIVLTAGTDYDDQGVLPQIAYLEARSSTSQTWDISIPIVDDSEFEGPESFTLHIFSGDVGVSVTPDTATVVIADNDGEIYIQIPIKKLISKIFSALFCRRARSS